MDLVSYRKPPDRYRVASTPIGRVREVGTSHGSNVPTEAVAKTAGTSHIIVPTPFQFQPYPPVSLSGDNQRATKQPISRA
jgi:hypothetical protein